MSATLSTATVTERGALATKRLRERLGLDNLKLLSTAVAEAAADEIERNPAFVARVQAIYQELVSRQPTRPLRTRKAQIEDVELVPVVDMSGVTLDPFAPLDPYLLHHIYGSTQLRAALTGYSLAKLKEGMATVEARNPGTKPKSKASKAALIDYIVERVAGTGH